MPEEPTTPPVVKPEPPAGDVTPPSSKDVKSEFVPYARFKEVNDRLKQLEADQAKIKAAEDAAAQAKLIEDGKMKEVITQLEAEKKELQKQADDFNTYLDKARGDLINKLPEDIRGHFQDEKDVVKLRTLVEKFSTSPAPGTSQDQPGGGQGEGKFGPEGQYSSRAEFAARDPNGYQKWKQSKRPPMVTYQQPLISEEPREAISRRSD